MRGHKKVYWLSALNTGEAKAQKNLNMFQAL